MRRSQKKLLYLINQFLEFISKLLIKTKILKRYVIIRIDGGICSQMYQYAIGQYFASKGYTVKYDITWFSKYGIDIVGKDKRTFDLLKAFPYLYFAKANKLEIILYRPFIYCNDYTDTTQSLSWMNLPPPVYLQGYYRTPRSFIQKHFKMFRFDNRILDYNNKEMLNFILQKAESVAVHVRRGDLSDYHSVYGSPVTVSYFTSAINYFYERLSSPFYFFFSDDTLYVKNELINNLRLTAGAYHIVDLNDPTNGYMDLFLIAACHHYITSKGSLGKYGALLRNDQESVVVLYDDSREREWQGKFPNTIYLN